MPNLFTLLRPTSDSALDFEYEMCNIALLSESAPMALLRSIAVASAQSSSQSSSPITVICTTIITGKRKITSEQMRLPRLTRCDQAAVVKRLGDKVADGRVHPVLLAEHRYGPAQKQQHQQQCAKRHGQGPENIRVAVGNLHHGAQWCRRDTISRAWIGQVA